ncbi:predicted protein [Naegleria gruberi]|uniref:Predicted protein n=1 Tax=Naegleria gruberi TaxID=5762 RepID=D2VTW7_NAEGR|nr:uncharacterized protein NAEGRDRAFT_52217 [Naegleria gruberi]EFC39729.1 predicted protein [Naegleria gruberi]|eukprot:XP_002672473.1 predicted protein [Naegleria gruberi strain NEG-M]
MQAQDCTSSSPCVEKLIIDLGKKIQQGENVEENSKLLKELEIQEGLPLSQNVSNMLYNLDIIKFSDEESLIKSVLYEDVKIMNEKKLYEWLESKMETDRECMLSYLIKPKRILEGEEKDQFERVRLGSICLRKIIEMLDPILFNWFSYETYQDLRQFYGEFTCDNFLPKSQGPISTFNLIMDLYWRKEYFTCFSIGITFLERTLGDLLLLVSKKSKDNPNDLVSIIENFRELKINELLMVEEIEEALGKEFVFIFRCFSGPLQGLNLRNVLWHGFLDSENFPRCFASFLILLIISISKREETKQVLENASSKQVRRSFNTMLDIPVNSGNPLRRDFSDYIKNGEHALEESFDLIDESYLIPYRSKRDWKKSIEYYRNGHIFLSFVTLFPHLEHALRRMFAYSNNNFERLFSAETDQVYTTFDEIMHPSIDYTEVSSNLTDGGDKTSTWTFENRNRIFEEIGDSLMLSLFDILFFKDGPRIRDKLSHGVVDPHQILEIENLSEQVIAIVMCIIFNCSTLNRENQSTNELTNKILELRNNFTFQTYHPQMNFFKEFDTTLEKFKSFVENTVSKAYYFRYKDEFTKKLFEKYPNTERGEKRFIVKQSSDLVNLIEVYNKRMQDIGHDSVVYRDLYQHNIKLNILLEEPSETETIQSLDLEMIQNSFATLKKTKMKPRLPLTFCGKVGNIQSIEFTKIYRLTDIVKASGQFVDEVTALLAELEEPILSRKAYSRHRKRFVYTCYNMIDFYNQCILQLMAVEFLSLSPVNKIELDERGIILRLARASPPSVKSSTLDKIEKLNLEWKTFIQNIQLEKSP